MIHNINTFMAQSHSKMATFTEETFIKDKLVLYINESEKQSKVIDMACYILYDEDEGEFLITGTRDQENVVNNKWGEPYKFYCRKKKHVMDFILSIFDMGNDLTMILYKYDNLYSRYDSFDEMGFYDFHDKNNHKREITGYNNVKLTDPSLVNYIKKNLKNLKHVRY
uniref:Uncharacterized protein n=1 Tax=viral metagenome TaxID=1070528 RepID=A0A6C0CUP8_9ZZZZ